MTNRAKLGIDGGAVHLKGNNQFSSLDMKDTAEDDQLYMIQDPITGEMFSIKYSTTNSSSLHKDISNEFEFIPEKIIVDDEDWVIIEEATSGDKRKVQTSNFIGEDIYADDIKVRLDSLMEVDWSSSTYLNSFTINVMKLNEISELFIDSGISFNHEVKMGNNNIINLLDPVNEQDAATKKYVDDNSGSNYVDELLIHGGSRLDWTDSNDLNFLSIDHINVSSISSPSGTLIQFSKDLSLTYTSKIINMADPINDQDGATKKYVDDNSGTLYVDELLIHDSSILDWERDTTGFTNTLKIDVINASVGITVSSISSYDGSSAIVCETDLSLHGNKITSLLDPIYEQDAATKKYVDDSIDTGRFLNRIEFKSSTSHFLTYTEILENEMIVFEYEANTRYITMPTLSSTEGYAKVITLSFAGGNTCNIRPSAGVSMWYLGQEVSSSQQLTFDNTSNVQTIVMQPYQETSTSFVEWAILSSSVLMTITSQ